MFIEVDWENPQIRWTHRARNLVDQTKGNIIGQTWTDDTFFQLRLRWERARCFPGFLLPG
jgi:hypothetical protein